MPRKKPTKIFSIFGQIEEVAASMMIERDKATRLEADQIPIRERTNPEGDEALFAIIVLGEHVDEFQNLIRDLRA